MTAKIEISTGSSAKSKKWRAQTIKWADLVRKLSKTTKTAETLVEFLRMSKDDQLNIKDVGGYVGGLLRGARRKPENVVHRQLITLDLDFANIEFWEDFALAFECAAVLHGTHKHQPSAAKYRLIIPLDRAVSPLEYEAIARRVAGDLGIELFDKTTFQPSRLMFWPSTPADQPYEFHEQKGDPLSADEMLATFTDWREVSSWPRHASEVVDLENRVGKQEDPTEKRGLIGAFCRTYTIQDAIAEHLADRYTETSTEGRYTFTAGSAAGGLTTYNNLFAYSHHGTDPASGQLCNAYDLVRLHKFGYLDEGSRATHNRPSDAKMADFCRDDKRTRETMARESVAAVREAFGEPAASPERVEPEAAEWLEVLDMDKKGAILPSAGNFSAIIRNDEQLKKAFKLNELDGRGYLCRSVKWRKVESPEPLKNVDFAGLRNYIERAYGIASSAKVEDALALEIQRESFHPIQDYLEALSWDGVERVDTLLIDYFGAVDNQYTREAIRKPLAAAVRRVYEHGAKFDLVLTLVGEQGNGKSTFLNRLGGRWFSDTFLTVQGKEALEQIQGVWLIEMAELSGLRKAEVESIKHFISKREDIFRPAYGRTAETFKRQCVFFGTTNKIGFLTDASGNRRFAPVLTKYSKDQPRPKGTPSPFTMTREDVAQIWAEVMATLRDEPLYFSPEAEAMATDAQREHVEHDDREGLVVEYLEAKLPDDWAKLDTYERRAYLELGGTKGAQRSKVCAAEIWVSAARLYTPRSYGSKRYIKQPKRLETLHRPR